MSRFSKATSRSLHSGTTLTLKHRPRTPTLGSTAACWSSAPTAEIHFNMFPREASSWAAITARSAPTGAVQLLAFGLGAAIQEASLRLWSSSTRVASTLGFVGGWRVTPVVPAKAGGLTRSMFSDAKGTPRRVHRHQHHLRLHQLPQLQLQERQLRQLHRGRRLVRDPLQHRDRDPRPSRDPERDYIGDQVSPIGSGVLPGGQRRPLQRIGDAGTGTCVGFTRYVQSRTPLFEEFISCKTASTIVRFWESVQTGSVFAAFPVSNAA
jgi:hypothetical protein